MLQRKHRSQALSVRTGGRAVRLLIESRHPAFEVDDFTHYLAAGFDVTLCSGPLHTATECPVVRGETCDLLSACDVVLVDLAAEEPVARDVVDVVNRAAPAVVSIVDANAPERLDVPDGSITLPSTTSVAGQLSVLRRVAGRSREPTEEQMS
jgi:hypothetical protein